MKKILHLILCVISLPVFGQLTVTLNDTASSLAHRLAGSGITISNPTLNCGNQASGTFVYSGSNFGIAHGIILTTGSAALAADSGQSTATLANGNNYTDPNLTAIEASATFDVCILEFDLVPSYNNLNMTFIFGSEEYPEYVGSSFNDVFGFFLTGPIPGGGNYSGTNIGVLPNSTPVSINNVNATTNSTYFHDNYTSPKSEIVYDGYTTPITTGLSVSAGTTYHLKIGIADAHDGIFDSGIFIKDSIFTSCPSPPNVTFTTLGFTDTLCSNAGPQTLTGGSPSGGNYIGNGVTGNSFNPMTAGPGLHSIVYTLTDSSGCSGTASHDVLVQSCTTGMGVIMQTSQLSLQPNPCRDILQINAPLLSEGRVEICNSMNQLVKTSRSAKHIDVSGLPNGIYFIRVFDEHGKWHTAKFVKE